MDYDASNASYRLTGESWVAEVSVGSHMENGGYSIATSRQNQENKCNWDILETDEDIF